MSNWGKNLEEIVWMIKKEKSLGRSKDGRSKFKQNGFKKNESY